MPPNRSSPFHYTTLRVEVETLSLLCFGYDVRQLLLGAGVLHLDRAFFLEFSEVMELLVDMLRPLMVLWILDRLDSIHVVVALQNGRLALLKSQVHSRRQNQMMPLAVLLAGTKHAVSAFKKFVPFLDPYLWKLPY